MKTRIVLAMLMLGQLASGYSPVAAAEEPSSTTYPVRMLTPKKAAEDVALARRALEMIHPGIYRYTTKADMDAAFTDLEQRIQRPITDVELYGRISILLAKMHCDHTKAEFPAALETYRNDHPTHLPFRFKLFDGRMYVVSSDPTQPQISRGTEILSINGVVVGEILQRLTAAVSFDGFTSFVTPRKLEADGDLMGSDFDTFYPIFYGFPVTLKLEIKAWKSTEVRTLTIRPITFRQWVELPWEDRTYRAEFYRETTWKMLNAKTAYLRIDTFVNYRHPVDAERYYAAFFKAINQSGADHLILDLRENGGGGGSSDPSISLMPFLLDRPFIWNKPVRLKTLRFGDLPKYIQTWGDPKEMFEPPVENYTKRVDGWFERAPGQRALEELPIEPSADRFTGRVTVLTSAVNGSGCTMAIAKLKDEGRVTLVGTATGGSAEGPTAGNIFFLKLPNSGITVRVPNMWDLMNISQFRRGYGVSPDVEVSTTIDDFMAGRDSTLEAALVKPVALQPVKVATVAQTHTVSKPFLGDWQGQLEYRDYTSNLRVILPTVLHVTPVYDGSMDFAYLYDDGPGKIVKDASTVTIDPTTRMYRSSTMDSHEEFVVTGVATFLARGDGELVLSGSTTENGQAVKVRTMITVSANSLIILRETAAMGESYQFRHRYSFVRSKP